MEPEILLEPEQPDEVVRAVAELVVPPEREPDPWWRAGIADALEP